MPPDLPLTGAAALPRRNRRAGRAEARAGMLFALP